jgi:MFS family permease
MWRLKRYRLRLFDETGFDRERVKSLKLVILAVAFGTVCFNITGGVAMTGYLKLLGVSDFVYGLILAIGPIATVLQVFASYVLERTRKRKFIFMLSGILQRTAWLPFGMVPILMPMSGPTLQIWTVVLFMLISSLTTPFINVSFFSFVADLVPTHIRGRYFSVRQRIALIFGIAGGLLTAFLLDRFSGFNGYALVFALAALFGTLDILTFIFIKFPPMLAEDQPKTDSLKKMLTDVFTNKRYMLVIGFATLWMFSIHISAPFAMVYARTVLDLSNTTITLAMQIFPSLCMVIVLPMWGRALDKYGNKPVMMISAGLAGINPIFWIFTFPGSFAVVPIIFSAAAGGLLSAGLDFGLQNVFLGQAPEKNRSMYVAVYSCLTSLIGIGLANTTGGWLLDNVFSIVERAPLIFNRYNYLFILAFVLRVSIGYIMLPRMITEEKTTPVREILQNAVKRVTQLTKRK